jgi:hypothetical protein
MLSFLKRVFSALSSGRQAQVDYEIAHLLHRNEYRNHAFSTVLNAVRSRNLDSLRND